jgi:catechol 2,3-dioxygenase-like lactoylglutathione lyase family enzyme
MRRITYLVAVVLPMLAYRIAIAQDAVEGTEAWVQGIGAPQYVAVQVADVDAAATWYRAAFGLDTLDDTEADDGSWRIVNLQNEHLFVEIIRDDRAQAVDRARGFFKVGFRVPDVEAVADRMAAATGDRPRVIDVEQHAIRIVQLRDPEGNMIQLSSSLAPQN